MEKILVANMDISLFTTLSIVVVVTCIIFVGFLLSLTPKIIGIYQYTVAMHRHTANISAGINKLARDIDRQDRERSEKDEKLKKAQLRARVYNPNEDKMKIIEGKAEDPFFN